jgi:FkbM family methyltransferase
VRSTSGLARLTAEPRALGRRLALRTRDALSARGLEIRRSGRGVRRTLPEVLQHYRRLGLEPRTVIDVGVAEGTPELYAAFCEAQLLLVEPLEEYSRSLQTIVRERGAQLVLAAAGPTAATMEIAVHRVPACSSLLGAHRGDNAEISWRCVPTVALDDVIVERALPGPYVLKVDVEGAELRVLEGATALLEQTELALLEVSLFELVADAPQLHDVVAWMHQHGFVVADFYNGHNRLLDGALAQVDVAFVKEDGRFRRVHDYATPEQADALYRSWGR